MASAVLLVSYIAGLLFGQVGDVMLDDFLKTVTPMAFVIQGHDQHFEFFESRALQKMVANDRRDLPARPCKALGVCL